MTKPVHSPAVPAPSEKPAKAAVKAANAKDNVRGSPARRQEVKSKTAKSTKSAKPKVATGKPVRSKTVVSKPSPKAAPKAKASVKVAAKPKVTAKTASKVTTKSKVVSKTKPAAKPAVKSSAKSLVKAKPSAKSVVKVANAIKKPVVKPTSKGVIKVLAKPIAKASAKPVSLLSVKPVAAPVASKTQKPVHVIQSVSKPVSPPVASLAASVPAPAKAGRPSSRLAQLTVPSMAQSIASTAAKASYSQVAHTPVVILAIPAAVKKDAKLANNWKTKPIEQLTDADLQAMPDSEYMNAVQLAAFRLKLVALKRDILNNAGETTEHLREDTSVVPDPADRATIEEEHALELRTRDRERKLLKKIEQSIDRIDANDYGYCDETGEPIGVGRLLARPTATLSLEAQQRRELKQKMFGD
jgi:DnaK suppressor protein